ncbi:WcbI family polysaccharide biosynthesis putative acetyltransferase [Acidisoma sp. L85]|uniref:WcbI family polysaccharide biosynthesis putative acetyltransferase n=1 Tax=Acidisoma sp. L85 TaxID=1641850 RepID=UPI00131C09E2|nr:WcbI family polysaccharide biosynthesis putative acetyltransferase [Acidisoma sp. L85]
MLPIDFLPGGNAKRFLQDGWSFQEPIGIWAVGSESAVLLPPVIASAPRRLSVQLFPLIAPPELMQQRVELILNGVLIYQTALTAEERNLTCAIPDELLQPDATNRLVIVHPDAAAPRDLNPLKTDPRRLAVCLRRIEFETPAKPGTQVEVASDQRNPRGPIAVAPRNERRLVLCRRDTLSSEIAQILRFFPPFEDAFDLRLITGTTPWSIVLQSLSPQDSGRLAAVWDQIVPEAVNQEPYLRGILPQSATYIRFPRLFINCLWPLRGHDPRLALEPQFPKGRYPYTDIAAAELRNEQLNDDALYARYMQRSAELMPDLDVEWDRDVSAWRTLDARCDVQLCPFIISHFHTTRLFYGPDLPCAPLLAYLVEQLLGGLLTQMQFSPSDVYNQFSDYIYGYQGMFLDQAPVHPFVLRKFNVPWLSTTYEYRRGHSKRTFREHIIDYIHWAPWFA